MESTHADTSSRIGAAIAYIPIVGWLYVFGSQRQNSFAIFHLRQSIGLVVFLAAVIVGWVVVTWVLAWIPYAFLFGIALFALVMVAVFSGVVILLLGLKNALGARQAVLPVFGEWANRLPIR